MTFSKQLFLPLLVFFFFFFLSEPLRCYSSSCTGNSLDVSFPFWLFPKHSSSCGYPRFNLYCTDRHETALNLPNSGPFLVQEIKSQRIRLNDPDNCLARRLLSFNASESPFSPLHFVNYTFLICPNQDLKSSSLKPIHCLGNSTTSFFATPLELVGSIPPSCQVEPTSSKGVASFNLPIWLPLKIFIFVFLLLNASEANRCYSASCGVRNVDVRFPFWLFPKQPESCGHTGFNLLCTERHDHETALKLPNSGLFLVREIDYENQRIRLNDPNNCLARRLLNFDASESPFSPLYLLNYTFLTCPKEDVKSSPYEPIHCLGNSTTNFFATRIHLVSSIPSSCQVFKTLLLPISSPLAVDLNDQDLWLKWDSPDCKDCEGNRSMCGFKNKTSLEVKCFKSGLYDFIMLILKLVCFFLIALLFTITTCVAYVTFSSERLPRQIRLSVARIVARKPYTGPAKYPISRFYKKVELDENMKLPGGNDVTCPICLSEYTRNETVGCLPGCEHCFHIECISTWLHLQCSCPICRNEVSPRSKFCSLYD